jgi:L,D-peptidoglycan transpeptidase YkuD (ErfK/YbiS/YcfS/YnhG family)
LAFATVRSGRVSIHALSPTKTHGIVILGERSFRCALGRGGIQARKREGDGATPLGTWRAQAVLYRADRVSRPQTRLCIRAIRPSDGWCDAIGDRNYNRPVQHPYPQSAERLWRDDHVYDLIIVLNHNMCPRSQGLGSAVFMHLARPGLLPTEGCIALVERDLRDVLIALTQHTRLVIR